MYFYQKPLQFMEEYDKLARIHKGDRVLFSYTRLENARKLMDVDEDVEFALWNDFGRNKFEFRGEKNISQLNGFIQDNMNP